MAIRMRQIALLERRKFLKLFVPLTLLMLGAAIIAVPIHLVAFSSVFAQEDVAEETTSELAPVTVTDFGGFEFDAGTINFSIYGDFSQLGREPGEVTGSLDFDFAGFFKVFDDQSLFEKAGGDYGGFAAIFDSVEKSGVEFSDFKDFGGSFHDLGGGFTRSDEALAAFDLTVDLAPEDLEIFGPGFAYDVLEDLDYFGFLQLGGDFVVQLLGLTRETRELRHLGFMTATQWAGVLGSMERDQILGLSDDLVDTALNAMDGRNFLLLSPNSAAGLYQATVLEIDPSGGQSLSSNLERFGEDAIGLLSAADHDFYFEIGDQMGDIFGSIDFLSLDLETSPVSSDDIGAMMAAADDALGDQGGVKISAAISLMDVGDFEDWTADVALEVIDTLGWSKY